MLRKEKTKENNKELVRQESGNGQLRAKSRQRPSKWKEHHQKKKSRDRRVKERFSKQRGGSCNFYILKTLVFVV